MLLTISAPLSEAKIVVRYHLVDYYPLLGFHVLDKSVDVFFVNGIETMMKARTAMLPEGLFGFCRLLPSARVSCIG